MSSQRLRRSGVRRKLNAMSAEFKDKNVLLVDDSIVRGNTSLEICLMAREAGAKSIIFASASPPIRHSHIYGSVPLFCIKTLATSRKDERLTTPSSTSFWNDRISND